MGTGDQGLGIGEKREEDITQRRGARRGEERKTG